MKYMRADGKVAELDFPADEHGMVYIKIDGEYQLVHYDEFIAEFRHIPKESQRIINDPTQ